MREADALGGKQIEVVLGPISPVRRRDRMEEVNRAAHLAEDRAPVPLGLFAAPPKDNPPL